MAVWFIGKYLIWSIMTIAQIVSEEREAWEEPAASLSAIRLSARVMRREGVEFEGVSLGLSLLIPLHRSALLLTLPGSV